MGGATFIKICGITRLADARAAVRSGANAVGFVFAQSLRRITPSRAVSITGHLHPSVRKVGVFVDATIDKLLEIVDRVGLDAVQLAGGETPDFVEALRRERPGLFVAKVVRVTDRTSVRAAEAYPGVDAIFFDPRSTTDPHAKSRRIPIAWLEGAGVPRFVVAGGLNPRNVGKVLSALHPWGVDVSSGVEAAPGRKDPEKIRAFVRAVRSAEAGNNQRR